MVDVWYLVTEVEQPGVKVQVGQLANTLCSLVVQAGIEQVATSSKLDQPVLPSRDLWETLRKEVISFRVNSERKIDNG